MARKKEQPFQTVQFVECYNHSCDPVIVVTQQPIDISIRDHVKTTLLRIEHFPSKLPEGTWKYLEKTYPILNIFQALQEHFTWN